MPGMFFQCTLVMGASRWAGNRQGVMDRQMWVSGRQVGGVGREQTGE